MCGGEKQIPETNRLMKECDGEFLSYSCSHDGEHDFSLDNVQYLFVMIYFV